MSWYPKLKPSHRDSSMAAQSSCDIASRWIPHHTLDEKSTLLQVMLGVVRQQTITWTNADTNLCHHMMSQGYNELIQSLAFRADSRFAPSQWETTLQSNAVSHLLDANLESALCIVWGAFFYFSSSDITSSGRSSSIITVSLTCHQSFPQPFPALTSQPSLPWHVGQPWCDL